MTELASVLIRAATPCCKRGVRLSALADVPREVYARRCPACGARWRVERRVLRTPDALDAAAVAAGGREALRATIKAGMRVDSLEWERQ